jgi:hypothetical protein
MASMTTADAHRPRGLPQDLFPVPHARVPSSSLARWCGRGRGKPGPYPIVRSALAYTQTHQVAHHHKKHVLMQ